ncbi:MAG: MFS transporter [Lentisphaeria bacterium]|nr:MFS transporter [Lentisphaeria bacterium]NQZ70550.1 MFS transporter [Lentisphaeria bacterium]
MAEEVEAAVKKSKIPWVNILRIALPFSFALNLGWFGVLTFVNLYITKELGHPAESWVMCSTIYIGFNAAGCLASGWIAPKIGIRQLMLISYMVMGIGYIGLAYTQNLFIIVGFMVFIGIATGLSSTAYHSMILGISGDRPGQCVSISVAILSILGAVIIVDMGEGIKQFDYNHVFSVCGIIMLLVGFCFYFTSAKVQRELQNTKDEDLFQVIKENWRELLRPGLFFLFLLGMFEPLIYHTANSLLPNLYEKFNVDEAYIGNIVGYTRLASVLGAFTIGIMFEWVRPKTRWGIGLSLVALSILLMGMVENINTVLAIFLFYNFVYVLNWCSNSVAFAEAMGEGKRTAAVAIMTSGMLTMTFLVGIFHTILLHHFKVSVSNVFIICGGIGVAAGIALIFIPHVKPKKN